MTSSRSSSLPNALVEIGEASPGDEAARLAKDIERRVALVPRLVAAARKGLNAVEAALVGAKLEEHARHEDMPIEARLQAALAALALHVPAPAEIEAASSVQTLASVVHDPCIGVGTLVLEVVRGLPDGAAIRVSVAYENRNDPSKTCAALRAAIGTLVGAPPAGLYVD